MPSVSAASAALSADFEIDAQPSGEIQSRSRVQHQRDVADGDRQRAARPP
jgi:hypothetical protein